MRILLLTLDTNKGAAGPACSSTPWLNHGSLGCYRDLSPESIITYYRLSAGVLMIRGLRPFLFLPLFTEVTLRLV
jgi:hypothetical protein